MAGLWLLVAVLSTWLFALEYVPTPEDAYASIVHAEGAMARADSPWVLYPRVVKWCAEQALVVIGLMLVATMWWRRTWTEGVGGACARWRWWLALAVPGLAMGWSFFGQLLPMDQHAWHGTVVRAGIIESTPLIGSMAREMLLAGRDISGATLSAFHGLHVGLLPALMLLAAVAILRPFLREIREKGLGKEVAIALSVPLQLALLAGLVGCSATELGLAARSHLPHPDVRPEWFFMPLSKALAVVGPGLLGTLVVLAPGGIATLLVLWPWIARRLSRSIQVAVLCGLGAGFCGLLAWEVAEDRANDAGWFAQHDLETLMTEMGKLNQELGYPGEHHLEIAFAKAAELQVMARLTHGLAGHKEVKDGGKWRGWARDMAAGAGAIWDSGGDLVKVNKAIADMRLACRNCHELHGEEADLYDSPQREIASTASQPDKSVTDGEELVPTDVDNPTISPEPELPLPTRAFLHPSDFEGLAPTIDTSVKLGAMMKRMVEQFDILNGPNKPAYAMAILNIEKGNQESAKMHGEFADLIEAEAWAEIVSEGVAAMVALRASENEAAYRENLSRVRQNCVKCHDALYVEDAKIKPVIR
jgi:quinol-cytochrome oxidoreductase complex cytochrome b subunit